MDATKWKIQKCSVRLWRCDSERGSCTRAEGGVSAAPRPGGPAVPHAADRGQEHDEMFVVKRECNDEDSVTTSDPSMAVQDIADNMSKLVKKEADFLIKTENEEWEVLIKQELDIGPIVLQPPPAQCSLPPLSQVPLQCWLQMYLIDHPLHPRSTEAGPYWLRSRGDARLNVPPLIEDRGRENSGIAARLFTKPAGYAPEQRH
ncbi:hypothetical protein EVAR_65663_1 [Eumeta japonica]|uniref:Uncharacterized protein n=1 Tax=Eumeta variegata TaxID=151549 RepID=A0A4C1ZAD6_EUMVA|nr:hypothetical protein EVAR_65663_1 [Eumeta japonica]